MILSLVLITSLFFIIVSWIRFTKDRRRTNLPGPKPYPIIGNGHLLAVDSSKFLPVLGGLCEQYGANILVYILSERYAIVTEPEVIETFAQFYGPLMLVQILHRRYVLLSDVGIIEPLISSTDFITKGISYTFLEPWLGKGLLTASGNRWKGHRKFLTPAFHFNILQNFLPVFCKNTKVLINKLEKKADGKTTIDLFPIIALDALDNVTESIMGVCVNAQKDSESEYVKAIEEVSNVASARMRNLFLAEDAIFNLLPHKTRQDKALKILHGTSMKVIAARREELKKLDINSLDYNSEFGIKNKHAFLDLLLLAEIDGQRIDDEKVREEVDTFMFEGHDTTASGIVFSMFCMSKRNDVQEKILSEQRSIFGDDLDRDPTFHELGQMKYLECVIKESLRLYPSVPLIERKIVKDTEISGIFFPKDTSVIIDIFHMHRRPEVYEDPLEFRPERYSLDSKDTRNAFAWLPFSAGPRNCIGQKFAMMELKVTLSAIVRNFKILPCDIEPILCADLILRAKNGVHVRLASRK